MNLSCTERWRDEEGCDSMNDEHQCTVMEEQPHRTHLCHCGAMVIEDPKWLEARP